MNLVHHFPAMPGRRRRLQEYENDTRLLWQDMGENLNVGDVKT